MPRLPDSIYQPDPLKSYSQTDWVTFFLGFLVAVAVGLVGATFGFAQQIGHSEKLFWAMASSPDVAGPLSYCSVFLVLLGLSAGPAFALVSGKQNLNLAFGGGLLLVTIGAVFYVYSRAIVYSPLAIFVWAYQFYDVPLMADAFTHSFVAFAVGFGLTALTLFLLFGLRKTWVTSKAHGSARWSEGNHFALGPKLSDSFAQRCFLQPLSMMLRKGLKKLPRGVRAHLGSLLPASTARESRPVPGIPMGRRSGRLCYDPSGVHQYVSAPTRSFKSVSFAVPTLLVYPGSMFVFDMKRELWHVTARRRAELNEGRVYRFDPFGERTARYNPMHIIKTRGPRSVVAADDAKMLAEMCVIRTGQEKNPFFVSSAQQLMTGLILWRAYQHDDLREENTDPELPEGTLPNGTLPERTLPERTLPAVRRLIMRPDLLDILAKMSCHYNDTVRGIGAQFTSETDQKTFSNILLTLQEQTFFLDSPVMQYALSATDLRFESLKEKLTTAYLMLPSDRMETYRRYVRLVKTCAQTELIRSKTHHEYNVVSLLDEFPRLGRFDQIEEGFSLHSGHGIQYIILTQSPAQMKENYAEAARSFETNAQNRLYWSVNDRETAKNISEEAGKMTVAVESSSQNRSRSRSTNPSSSQGTSNSIQEKARPLVTPREVMDTPSEWCFIFNRDHRPTLLRRVNYLTDDYFDGLYDPHPAHDPPEAVARAKEHLRKVLLFPGVPTPQHGQADFDSLDDRNDASMEGEAADMKAPGQEAGNQQAPRQEAPRQEASRESPPAQRQQRQFTISR